MKNCIDMPIFHTAICVEASQICFCMHNLKLHSKFGLYFLSESASEWR